MDANFSFSLACYEISAKQLCQLKKGRNASARKIIEPFLKNPFQRSGEVRATSCISNILYILLYLIGIQIMVALVVSSKESMSNILTFLGCDASIISSSKGVEKEDQDPLIKEPPIRSMGGCGGLTSTTDGMFQCLDKAPHFCLLLDPSHSERG